MDYIATDGDIGFDCLHRDFFLIIEPIINSKITYKEKINQMITFTHIPVNDPLHLFKNGRSHLLNHPLMVNPQTMRCVNIELYQKATGLTKEIYDRSNIASMKDFYALSIFSWENFQKLIENNRYDGAFYNLPFVFMIQAITSNVLNRFDRLSLLENAIKYFIFHLNNVRKSHSRDFFTPSYHKSSIGTLFGEEIFIIRNINTCIALSIALLRNDEVAFSRIGSHAVESHFGLVRLFSHFNNTFENAVNATINSILLKDVCYKLKYKYNIKSRINEAGAYVDKNILNSKSSNIDFNLITDTVFLRLRGVEITMKQSMIFIDNMNHFHKLTKTNSPIRVQNEFCGRYPYFRLRTNSWALSMMPLPAITNDVPSLFSFYDSKTSSKKKTN